MRFVVLHHTGWPGHVDHYDLLLENRESSDDDARTLTAYATVEDEFPSAGTRLKRNADHRRQYLWYEGPVGGGRGNVTRVDEGELSWNGPLAFRCDGARLRGHFQIATRADHAPALIDDERFIPLPLATLATAKGKKKKRKA